MINVLLCFFFCFLEQPNLLFWDNYKVEDKCDDEYETEVQHKVTGKCPGLI